VVLYVSITRWTPQTALALRKRWDTVVKGTAPKAVLDAFAKFKVITQVMSLVNNLSVMVYEIEEKDSVETNNVAVYLQDVCTMETYPVISFEDWMKVMEAVPIEKIPKPEPWWKT